MVDVAKHVHYWMEGAQEDCEAAEALWRSGHGRNALFLAHLSLEKQLKALVTMVTGSVPPRIHNLVRLAELADIELSDSERDILTVFTNYCFDGRYPDVDEKMEPEKDEVDFRIGQLPELLAWLRRKL